MIPTPRLDSSSGPHTDAGRAYDLPSPIGRLDRALVEAAENGWTVASLRTGRLGPAPSPPLALASAYGSRNPRTRKAAICSRVTAFSGQKSPPPQPPVTPSRQSCSTKPPAQ